MKRLALLVAAVAVCVMFTACPEPEESVVVIPDGTYEETASIKATSKWKYDSVLYVLRDTVMSTIVDIIDGGFNYREMCEDTVWSVSENSAALCYYSHFIYDEYWYCPSCQIWHGRVVSADSTRRLPVQVTNDGCVLVRRPYFYRLETVSWDTAYERKFRVYRDGELYRFDQEHRMSEITHIAEILTSHTLRPLSNQ